MSVRKAIVAAGVAYVAATGLLQHYDAEVAHWLVALVEPTAQLLASSLKVTGVSVDNIDRQTVFSSLETQLTRCSLKTAPSRPA